MILLAALGAGLVSVVVARQGSLAAETKATEPAETPVTPVFHEGFGITAEQANELAQIRSRLLIRVWTLQQQMEPLRQRLIELMSAPAADRNAVASAVTDLSRTEAQLHEAGADAWIAARAVLTDFQRQELGGWRKLPQGCDLCRLLYRPGLVGIYSGFDIKCPCCQMLGIPKPLPSTHEVEDELPLCPVCGREVDPKENPPAFTYQGMKIYVCTAECAALLQQNPEAYLEDYFEQ
jgi:YHS domain-containing protein/Spy/CpxP family protein refolding chaperone